MSLSTSAAYRLGCRINVNMPESLRGRVRLVMSAVRHPSYIPTWFTPIAFVRWREFEYAFSALGDCVPLDRMLDVGSPKLFPITVARHCPRSFVSAIDLVEPDLRELQEGRELLGLSNLHPERMDARDLAFPDSSFDVVTSISVIEHIAPEDGGDEKAMREIRRVLKPGGTAIIVVPFAPKYFAEFHYGSVYEREALSQERNFYQRFYDSERLRRCIIDASGMEVVDLKFIDERHPSKSPHRRYAQRIALNHQHVKRFGLLYPILAKILLSRPKPLMRCRKPYIACLTLRRPMNG